MLAFIYPPAMAILRSVMSYPDFLLILIFCFHIEKQAHARIFQHTAVDKFKFSTEYSNIF